MAYVLEQLDLTRLRPLVAHLYSPTQGAPAKVPEDMLRSLLAMVLSGVFSIDIWVDMMRSVPFYAVVSGFDPVHVPGVGTFHLFMDRLLGLIDNPPSHIRRPRPKAKDTEAQSRDKNRDTAKHQGIIDRLAKRITEAGRSRRAARVGDDRTALGQPDWTFPPATRCRRYEAVLKAIFYTLFVPHSVELGLIDLDNLYLTGDSTKVGTWANPHGKRLCSCPKTEPCNCPRRYQDPTARWGWDSYREVFVYGHSLYELCDYSMDHTFQLPVVVSLFDAHRHDSVLAVAALHEAIDKLGLPVRAASFDMASDCLAFYRLGYEHWQIALVIPLNGRNLGHFTYPAARIDEHGLPHCPAGHAMAYWGHCRDRDRIKWRCPLKAGRKTASQQCEHQGDCSPSPYGRVVYTHPRTNYRLFTPIPRGTALWERHYDHHSASERSHKRKKYDFSLLSTRTALRERIFLRVMLMAMAQHLAAWAALSQQRGDSHQLGPAA